jgi:hypothetical protein
MSNATLTLIGWGLFYWVVFLYLFWVLVERTFSVATDPKRREHRAPDGTAGSTTRDPHPTPHVPSIPALGPPA